MFPLANCSAGYYRDISSNACVECLKGTYQSDKWSTSCINCTNDSTTSGSGTVAASDCNSKILIIVFLYLLIYWWTVY